MAVNRQDNDGTGADERRIDALYRQAAVEEPPTHLDTRIRDAARRPLAPAAPAKRNRWWQSWQVPFAVAAVVVLSVSLVRLVEREGGDSLTLEPSAIAPGAPERRLRDAGPRREVTPEGPQTFTAPSADEAGSTPDAGAPRVERRAQSPARAARRDEGSSLSRVPPASPSTAAEPAEIDGRAGTQAFRRDKPAESASRAGSVGQGPELPERDASPVPAPAAPPAPSPAQPSAKAMARQARPDATGDSASGVTARSADRRERSSSLTSEIAALMAELDGRPPARWIERILTLRREGRQDAADALLREFQRRYPDEPLPLQK